MFPLYRATKGEPEVRRARRDASWHDDLRRLQRRALKFIGPLMPRNAPIEYWDIPGTAHVLGRAASYNEWRNDALDYMVDEGHFVADRDLAALPQVSPDTAHLYNLVFFTLPDASALGTNAHATPLSIAGPGCTSIMSTMTLPVYHAFWVARARTGHPGLFRRPLWPAERRDDLLAALNVAATVRAAEQRDGGDDDIVEAAETAAERTARYKSHIYTHTACLLCGAPNGGPIHMATTCTRREIIDRRDTTVLKTLGSEMLALGDALAQAMHVAKPDAALHAAAAALKADDGAEGTFIAAHFVTATPWPAIAPRNDWHVAKALGGLFDKNPKGASLAAFSNKWMTAANDAVRIICSDWTELLSPAQARALVDAGHVYAPSGADRRL